MGHPEVWGPAGERLLIAGLTGGIASGKTEVDRELEALGAYVVDADAVSRETTEPGTPTFSALVDAFGEGILDAQGRLDRQALASAVFTDEDKLRRLNSITHPAIFMEIAGRVRDYAEGLSGDQVPAVVVDAALIVDAGVSGLFDVVVVVTSDEGLRARRLVELRGMDEAEARSRIASQVPESDRVAMADIVIDNNGSLEELRERVRQAWDEIARRAGA